jgi:hypothetical protein
MSKDKDTIRKQFTQTEKAKRGWWFSIVFMFLVICLIVFLAFIPLQKDNRDIIVGMIGMITGAISSMLSIAAGRDPSEVEALKDKLSSANADREALIARLRDAQIQLQLKNEQVQDLQTAIINRLSVFEKNELKKRTEQEIMLDPTIEQWLPNTKT